MITNEILLIFSVFIYFGGFLAFYYLFGKTGLIIWNCMALIMANIEVLVLIDAFGLTMTLGNVCFATTFLVTDLLCERYGRKEAHKAVKIGFLTTFIFILASQLWLKFIPASEDIAMPHFNVIFSHTPRIIFAGLVVYVMVQFLDVKLYQEWWRITEKLHPDKKRFLWIRNNGSTLISQFFNSILFNAIAFYGVFPNRELMGIIISTYLIYIIVALLDTPFLYIARNFHTKDLLD